jgi:deoxyribonuclease-4
MDVRGAFKDRHQRIGAGHIGEAAFVELFEHPATAGVPFILETPDSRSADNRDIPLLKRLRG